MMAVARMTLPMLLPSAATMAMASTKRGKAMMASLRRETIRSVQPPKKPAQAPAAVPDEERQGHRADGDDEVEPGGHQHAAQHVAPELIGAEPVRPRGRLELPRGVGGERIVGRDPGTEEGHQDDQHEEGEGEQGHRVLGDHVARVAQAGAHASILTRGSIRP